MGPSTFQSRDNFLSTREWQYSAGLYNTQCQCYADSTMLNNFYNIKPKCKVISLAAAGGHDNQQITIKHPQ